MFSFLQNKCQRLKGPPQIPLPQASSRFQTNSSISISRRRSHELYRNEDLSTSGHTSVLRWLMHPLVPIRPQGVFIQGNGQGNFLRILCAAPTTSQNLRGILFSTGRTLRQWSSKPPGFSTSAAQTVFPRAILKTSSHSSSRLPSPLLPRQALPPLFPAFLQIPHTRL